ncbi:hypothetical protein A9G11_09535 [Gilliamella sp. wkB108]|uniref:aldose 1-epimerase family protein n=1 Tax=Gilliamella sp. wkB108 TaxID=3120256 RepID=UPI00080EABFE|nr:aldose 1-epimerase family protein [Gilliamella apicola]OCG20927.1 hypothetical protein A9G11_09535 [Gilliamella apicola]
MTWFNHLTRTEFLQYVGDIHQLAGATSSTLNDGPGFNMRLCDIHTASGLNFSVLPDRGMDICFCRFKGIPIAPISKVGLQNPEKVSDADYDFFKNFHCGLLTTCGLNHIGPPSNKHGLHGPISNLRAERFSIDEFWQQDDYIIRVKGTMRQAVFFGENIQLQRTIETSLKSSEFTITDTITNQAFKEETLRLLYHINFGFPFLSPESEIILPEVKTRPRDMNAEKGFEHYLNVTTPQDNYDEQVYLHQLTDHGISQFSIKNKPLGLMVSCQFNSSQLPYLTQWNQFGKNEYVLGLEPGLDYPLTESKSQLTLLPLESFSTSLTFKFRSI